MERTSLVGAVLLLLLCGCGRSTAPAPTTTVCVRESLIRQTSQDFANQCPTGSDVCAYNHPCVDHPQEYLADQFSNLLSRCGGALELDELQEVFQTAVGRYHERNSDAHSCYVAFYEAGDPNYVLAQFGDCRRWGSHGRPARSLYVFSGTGETWFIGRGGAGDIYEVHAVGDGWVFVVNYATSGASIEQNYGVWHVKQADGKWSKEELVSAYWRGASNLGDAELEASVYTRAPSCPSLAIEEDNRLTVTYSGYNCGLPCQIGSNTARQEEVVYGCGSDPLTFFDYTSVFDWRDGRYVQADQQEEVARVVDHTNTAIVDWQDYCVD